MAERVHTLVTKPLIIVSVIIPLLSLGAIYLRFKSRKMAQMLLQADDWWIIASWIFALSLSINSWVFGAIAGIDYYKIDPAIGTTDSLKCILISSCLVQPALTVVKIAILLFYKRVFSSNDRFRVAVWIAIVIVSCWGILFFFLVLLETDPVSGSWTGKGHARFSPTPLALAQVGTSIGLDVAVLCLPLPVIYRLHMPTRKKIFVGLIFWLGAFCCVAAIVRLVLVSQSLNQVHKSRSAVYTQSVQFVFMILEPNCSIIAACLPCYGPLVAGGRAPESIVRSVRSAFSLRSFRSRRSGSSSDKNHTALDSGAHQGPKDDSLLQLNERSNDWPQTHHDTQVLAANDKDEPQTFTSDRVINVTRGVDVERG
ncbi:hypothetical protein F5Y00DRAFT_263025 [Daldinia vernicosa]|uniref:uncharacterized protein n=1 Tax=Daldinia vernicosa TaxID=114800 RepID=UPI002008DF96|nr:uncharacterized protein F5Y00DRAFT_263025 [Daldinia vernicosa]KAI0847852.1 hypothetical protein F5Y00DRAFT_263025 [Daldinia vernicosa]